MKNKKCELCEFKKGIEKHHIIKRIEGGSDKEENLVYLCPNHHWIADFGTFKEKKFILKEIKKITGKYGKEINKKEKKILDEKIKVLQSEIFNYNFTNKEWEQHKKTWNYENQFKMLLGRGCSLAQFYSLHKRAEILILIKKLNNELKNLK